MRAVPLMVQAAVTISSPAVVVGIYVLSALLLIAAIAVILLKDARSSAAAAVIILILLAIMSLLLGIRGAAWLAAVLVVAAVAIGGLLLPFSARLSLHTEPRRFPLRLLFPGLIAAAGLLALLLVVQLRASWPASAGLIRSSLGAVLGHDAIVASGVAVLTVAAAALATWAFLSPAAGPASLGTEAAGRHPAPSPSGHRPGRAGPHAEQRPGRGRRQGR
jgi:hypothetical protein